MDSLIPIAIAVGIGVIAVTAIVGAIFYERKRTEKMQAVAEELGLQFAVKGDPTLVGRLSAFNLFSQGRAQIVSNMIHGETADVYIGIFDYRYTTGSGKSSQTSKQTVIYFDSPELDLPKFALRPEGMFDKIGSALGFQDIDFDSHPRFSGAFVLRGDSEPLIRRAFRDEVLTYLEDDRRINVEGAGQRLIVYYARRRTKPADIRSLMERGFDVFTLLRGTQAPIEGTP